MNVARTAEIAAALTGAQSLTGSFAGDTLTGRDDAAATAIDSISGLTGNDIIYGRAGADIIDGGRGNDIIFGGAGADIIDGGRGNDIIFGGAGADTIDGGIGIDTANYFTPLRGDAVNVDGITYDFTDATSAYVGVGGDAAGDKLTNIERIIGTDAQGEVNSRGERTGTGDHFTISTGSGAGNLNSNGNNIRFLDARGGDDTVEIDLTSATGNGIKLYGGGGSDTLVLAGAADNGIRSLTINLAAGKLTFFKVGDRKAYTMDLKGFENVELTDAVYFGKWAIIGNNAANTVTLRGENSRSEGATDDFGVVIPPRNLGQLDGRIIFGGGNDHLVLDATRVNDAGVRVNAPTNYNLNIEGGAGTDTVTFANRHVGPAYGTSESDPRSVTTVNLGKTGLQQGFSNRFTIDSTDTGDVISGSSARFVGIENLEAGKESDYTFIGNSAVANRFTSLEDKTLGSVDSSNVASIRGTHTFISYGGPRDTFDIAETLPHTRNANADIELFSASANDRIANEEFFSDTMNKVSWSFEFASRGVTIDLNEIHTGRASRFVMDKITGSKHADTITLGSHVVGNVYGGGGNDVLTGGGNTNVLRGGAGNDRLISNRMQSDISKGFMYGEAGNDIFEPTRITGRDGLKLDGGSGTDTLDFTHDNLKYDQGDAIYLYAEGIGDNVRSTAKTGFGVDVTIGGTANAYKVGTSVTYLQLVKSMTSIENAIGTKVDDLLTGDGNNNRLDGSGAAMISSKVSVVMTRL